MASTRYEFRVSGRLPADVRADLDEFELEEAPVETVMIGEVVDEAHLHGVLARLQALGLHTLSLRSPPH